MALESLPGQISFVVLVLTLVNKKIDLEMMFLKQMFLKQMLLKKCNRAMVL